MRNKAILIGCLFTFCFIQNAFAQLVSGLITYRQKSFIKKEATNNDIPINKILPEYVFSIISLAFVNNQFKYVETAEAGSMNLIKNDSNNVYVDLKFKKIYNRFCYDNKYYYTVKPWIQCDIQYLNNEKIILGYACKSALITTNKYKYMVWYYPNWYRYSPLPEIFNSIPGVVLEYVSDVTYCIATNIDTKKHISINAFNSNISSNEIITDDQQQELENNFKAKRINDLKIKYGNLVR